MIDENIKFLKKYLPLIPNDRLGAVKKMVENSEKMVTELKLNDQQLTKLGGMLANLVLNLGNILYSIGKNTPEFDEAYRTIFKHNEDSRTEEKIRAYEQELNDKINAVQSEAKTYQESMADIDEMWLGQKPIEPPTAPDDQAESINVEPKE